MDRKRILISGAGIAGLTFAIELKRRGLEPVVIEREPGLRAEGYMMDFFGSDWDVASRIGLIEALRAVRYPIDDLEFADGKGKPYARYPVERIHGALDNQYVYLRRPDLERILAERAHEVGVDIRYSTSISALNDRGDAIYARFEGGGEDAFVLVVGADGVHSRVRELAFAPEAQFARFLGLYVAAFHVPSEGFSIGRQVKLYEEPDHFAFLYPLSEAKLDATLCFRHAEMDIRPRGPHRLSARRIPRRRLDHQRCHRRLHRERTGLFRQRDADCHAAMAQGTRRPDRRCLRLPDAAGGPRLAHGDGGRLCAGPRLGAARRPCRGLCRLPSLHEAGDREAAEKRAPVRRPHGAVNKFARMAAAAFYQSVLQPAGAGERPALLRRQKHLRRPHGLGHGAQ